VTLHDGRFLGGDWALDKGKFSRQEGADMTELRIDNGAGAFEIARIEAAAFCEHLKTHGITSNWLLHPMVAQWTEASTATMPKSDLVLVRIDQPDRLHEVQKLYRAWRASLAV
jgi:hypothetical protein